MSRIGKQPIVLPDGVSAKIEGHKVSISGKKGNLEIELHRLVTLTQQDNVLSVAVHDPSDVKQSALWGLSQRLVSNMVTGVTEGYTKSLDLVGVGFKAAVTGKKLVLNIGFSHPYEYTIPEGIEIKAEKNVVVISGIEKQLVGQVAAEIRAIKKPEPYKGKGIRYTGEVVKKKAGKSAAKGQ